MSNNAYGKEKFQSEFALQSFFYLIRLVGAGDDLQIENTGLTMSQAQRIRNIPFETLHEVAMMSVRTNAIQIKFDSELVEKTLKLAEQHSQERDMTRDMIKAGASYKIMQHFSGIGKDEFSRIRKSLGLSETDVGRFEIPDEATQQRIWDAWKSFKSEMDERQKLLQVAKEIGIKIRVIWALLEEWQKTGLVPDNPSAELNPLLKTDKKGINHKRVH